METKLPARMQYLFFSFFNCGDQVLNAQTGSGIDSLRRSGKPVTRNTQFGELYAQALFGQHAGHDTAQPGMHVVVFIRYNAARGGSLSHGCAVKVFRTGSM